MIPNLYIGNGCFTKHPFINGCLGFQALKPIKNKWNKKTQLKYLDVQTRNLISLFRSWIIDPKKTCHLLYPVNFWKICCKWWWNDEHKRFFCCKEACFFNLVFAPPRPAPDFSASLLKVGWNNSLKFCFFSKICFGWIMPLSKYVYSLFNVIHKHVHSTKLSNSHKPSSFGHEFCFPRNPNSLLNSRWWHRSQKG